MVLLLRELLRLIEPQGNADGSHQEEEICQLKTLCAHVEPLRKRAVSFTID